MHSFAGEHGGHAVCFVRVRRDCDLLPLYMVANGGASAGLFLTLQGLVVIVCRFVLRKKSLRTAVGIRG